MDEDDKKEEDRKVDPGDYRVLLHAILKQAMDDYFLCEGWA